MASKVMLLIALLTQTALGLASPALLRCVHPDGKSMVEWSNDRCCSPPLGREQCCCEERESSGEEQIVSLQACCEDTPLEQSQFISPVADNFYSSSHLGVGAPPLPPAIPCYESHALPIFLGAASGPPRSSALRHVETTVIRC